MDLGRVGRERPPGIPSRTLRLAERLRNAGVGDDALPREAWLRLREVEGERATMIDLYALVAALRGLLPNELPAEERLMLWRSVAAVIWPGFEVAQGSTRRNDPVDVVEYDPRWPAAFSAWRDAIAQALGEFALAIEHIGSTSVPGLAAKPRIDGDDGIGYTDAKSEIILDLLAEARIWDARGLLHNWE